VLDNISKLRSLSKMAAALDHLPLGTLAAGPVVDSASITPPQSANGKKDVPEGVPSELSDLELDQKSAQVPHETLIKQEEQEEQEVDIGPIEPDHYYGDGKIPVFKPVSRAVACPALQACR
jgi:hypothetical protein